MRNMVGILFTGGATPSAAMVQEVLQLDWVQQSSLKEGGKSSLKVIAADSGAGVAVDAGFLPELVVGDMDSIEPYFLEKLQNKGVKIQKFAKDKDKSDTEIGLDILVASNCFPILLIGGGGGRLDHLMALLQDLKKSNAPDIWLTDTSVVYKLKLFHQKSAKFLIEPNREVSFFPLSAGTFNLKTDGLNWNLHDYPFDTENYSLSNYSKSGKFSLLFQGDKEQSIAVVSLLSSDLKRID